MGNSYAWPHQLYLLNSGACSMFVFVQMYIDDFGITAWTYLNVSEVVQSAWITNCQLYHKRGNQDTLLHSCGNFPDCLAQLQTIFIFFTL